MTRKLTTLLLALFLPVLAIHSVMAQKAPAAPTAMSVEKILELAAKPDDRTKPLHKVMGEIFDDGKGYDFEVVVKIPGSVQTNRVKNSTAKWIDGKIVHEMNMAGAPYPDKRMVMVVEYDAKNDRILKHVKNPGFGDPTSSVLVGKRVPGKRVIKYTMKSPGSTTTAVETYTDEGCQWTETITRDNGRVIRIFGKATKTK